MGSLNQTAHLLTDVLTVERGPLIGAWKGKNLRRGLSPAHDARGKMGQYPSETYLHVL